MRDLTEPLASAIIVSASPKRELLITHLSHINGEEVVTMLRVYVTEEQFKQYNTALGRDVS